MRPLLALLLLSSVGCLGSYTPGTEPIEGDDDGPTPDAAPVEEEDTPDAAPVVPTGRATAGLQALYAFDEGIGATIHDTSAIGTAADLVVTKPGLSTWTPTGLRIDASNLIRTNAPATKIITACMASNEITVEAWVTPKSIDNGNVAARIAGVSIDTGTRNFSLIQQNASYEFRLRTGATDVNGTPATVATNAATILPQHVVYTRDTLGAAKLYIDSVEKATLAVPDTFANWDASYELSMVNEITQDRPWLGTLHLVAVYCKALTPEEIARNFAEGY